MSKTTYRIQEYTSALPARWSYQGVDLDTPPAVGCQVWTDAEQVAEVVLGGEVEGRYDGDTLVVIEASALSRGALCWSVVVPAAVLSVREVDLFELRDALDGGESFLSAVDRLARPCAVEFDDTLAGLCEAIEETFARAGSTAPVVID